MHPLGAAPGGLHGAALLGAQEALGLDAQRAGPAQPAALGHLQDPVTRLHPRGQQGQGEQSKHQVVSWLFTRSFSQLSKLFLFGGQSAGRQLIKSPFFGRLWSPLSKLLSALTRLSFRFDVIRETLQVQKYRLYSAYLVG